MAAEESARRRPAAVWLLWAAVFAVGAASVIWLQRAPPAEDAPAPADWPEAEVDGIAYRQFSPAGELSWRLDAASGTLFGADAQSGRPAYATLRDSTVTHWRPGGGEGQPTRFGAPELTVWPDAERLQGDGPIALSAPEGEFSAIGLEMFLKSQRVELKSRVRGRHALR